MIASPRKAEEAFGLAPPQKRTTTTSESEGSFAFVCLVFLTFVIYVAPQIIFPFLEPLHLAMVSAVLGVAAYVHAVIRGYRWTIISREMKLVLYLLILAVVSIPFSGWPGGSYVFFSDVFIKSIIVFFLVANLLNSENRIRKFMWALALFQAYNAYQGFNRFSSGEVYKHRGGSRGGVSGLTNDPNDLALALTMTIPFVWFLFETSRSKLQKWVSGAALVLLLTGVVLSYSRGGFLALLAMFLWFAYRKVKEGKKGVMVKAGLAFILMLVLAPGSYTDRILSIGDSTLDATGSATSRWNLNVAAAKIIVAHPLGAGLKMHNILLPGIEAGWAGVHNSFLEVTADLGVAGGIVFCMIIWKLFVAMGRISADFRRALGEVGSLAEATQTSLVAFAVGGFFLAQAYTFPLYILAGMAVALKDVAERRAGVCKSVPDSRPAMSRFRVGSEGISGA